MYSNADNGRKSHPHTFHAFQRRRRAGGSTIFFFLSPGQKYPATGIPRDRMASSGCSLFLLLLLLFLNGVLTDDADTTTMMIVSEGEVKDVGQEVIENYRAGEMRDQAVNIG